MRLIQQFLRDETGATAIEYGIIAAMIAIALIGSLQIFTNVLSGKMNFIGNAITNGG